MYSESELRDLQDSGVAGDSVTLITDCTVGSHISIHVFFKCITTFMLKTLQYNRITESMLYKVCIC